MVVCQYVVIVIVVADGLVVTVVAVADADVAVVLEVNEGVHCLTLTCRASVIMKSLWACHDKVAQGTLVQNAKHRDHDLMLILLLQVDYNVLVDRVI